MGGVIVISRTLINLIAVTHKQYYSCLIECTDARTILPYVTANVVLF